ncbi:hypothetical protein FOS03_24225 [Bacillus paranthracis]|uniref:Uncharacterized protein n=1 Tax=Bacillus thuringiensis serovar mexicanensis TaxID=180868 RepID=A0A242VXV0_BACTU|nr:hypothetical protein [Bacillus paranthracis]OTW43953.1 hypothetical protein BK699_35130 [Bacillus thuringiensis serovar mexicanensis]
MPLYIFIIHNENFFFLTHYLQITYFQNRFYNRIEGTSVPESSKYFPINIFIKKEKQGFFTSMFLFFVLGNN